MALTQDDIQKAAELLGVSPSAIMAVIDVESAGKGFLPDGQVKILFEGHVFFRELSKRGINPKPYYTKYPDIVYPSWDRSKYRNGSGEWERLLIAISINREAALCSASWGLFQIMGFNHASCGFSTVEEFVDAQKDEASQLYSFCQFLRHEGIAEFLRDRDWAAFARRYNGAGYAANQYDVKLARAYAQHKGAGIA